MLKINEVFFSIQGESSLAGAPTVFVRTSGCHLRCHYCDTTYAYHEGDKKTDEALLAEIKKYPTKFVCITGGEPLLQPDIFSLMTSLCDQGYFVSLETSGAVSCEKVDSRVKKIIDIKTPDSGAANTFISDNLAYATPQDEYKFVVTSQKDFDWAIAFVREHCLDKNNLVLFSPSFEDVEPSWLAQRLLESGVSARMQLQLHKLIWPKETRGV